MDPVQLIEQAIIERFVNNGTTETQRSTVATIAEDLGKSQSWVRRHLPKDKYGPHNFRGAELVRGMRCNSVIFMPSRKHLAFMIRKLRGTP